MNHRDEPYLSSPESLVVEAKKLSVLILGNLKDPDCPTINDLYKGADKIVRQKHKFHELGLENNSYLTKKNKDNKFKNELKGLYIMAEQEGTEVNPVYVGISRTIYRRIRQHGWGKSPNTCSLAYLMTKELETSKEIERGTVTNIDLCPSKKIIRDYKITFIPLDNDYELYFLEVALAGIFKTKWNSFKTH